MRITIALFSLLSILGQSPDASKVHDTKIASTTSDTSALVQVPTLTTEQKHALQLASKDVEIAQLHLQLAQIEAQFAQQQMQRLAKEYTPEGYRINQQLELERVPEVKK